MIKYSYFRVPTNKSRPGFISVAIERPAKEDPNQTHIVSFAFCNPKDCFKKSLGRQIAEGRLAKKSVTIVHSGTISDITREALKKLVEENVAPSWVCKAYKADKIFFGLSSEMRVSSAA